MLSTTAVFLAILSSGVFAQNNDWTKPCLSGECFYDLPQSTGTSGTMRVWGASEAISDITTAAGWTILDCDANALSQNIRLVCTGADDDCNHLFSGAGAVHTLVRLPQNCGASAFARVSRSWVHADQSIPASVASQLRRKRQAAPVVQGLAVDTNFADADPVNGNVSIAIAGSNVPGQTGNLTVTPPPAPQRRSRLQNRGLFSFIEDAFKKFNDFDDSVTKSLPPIDVDKQFPVFSQSISCPSPAVSASVSVDVDAKAHAVITLGMSAVGQIIPPALSEFGVFAGLDASMSGTMTLKGSATVGVPYWNIGSIDSGSVNVFQTGIPGLDFPGILTIGPTFSINVQGTGNLDVQADATMVLSYNVQGAKLFFPHSDTQTSGGNFNPGDSPLSLSVQPSVSSKAVLGAHVIPRIDLGVSGLGGAASATVSLSLDAAATMTMSLNGTASAAVNTKAPAAASGSVGGCVDIGASLNVAASADGDFFGLFDKSTSVGFLYLVSSWIFSQNSLGEPVQQELRSPQEVLQRRHWWNPPRASGH
ncbi:hypothetical protein B0H16DRAFT_1306404 [Mycena metata]|uniref:DUF7223 domain-containing protein n=1 Tax=Mycena metata TaxID=1033252 RepID=A0AAD7JUF6_9AGAR|nr:hypothetical protein B0H16DRAFT_1306404 [Mycena metata]